MASFWRKRCAEPFWLADWVASSDAHRPRSLLAAGIVRAFQGLLGAPQCASGLVSWVGCYLCSWRGLSRLQRAIFSAMRLALIRIGSSSLDLSKATFGARSWVGRYPSGSKGRALPLWPFWGASRRLSRCHPGLSWRSKKGEPLAGLSFDGGLPDHLELSGSTGGYLKLLLQVAQGATGKD